MARISVTRVRGGAESFEDVVHLGEGEAGVELLLALAVGTASAVP